MSDKLGAYAAENVNVLDLSNVVQRF